MSQYEPSVEHEVTATMKYIFDSVKPKTYSGAKKDYLDVAFAIPDYRPNPIHNTSKVTSDLYSITPTQPTGLYTNIPQQPQSYKPVTKPFHYNESCSEYRC